MRRAAILEELIRHRSPHCLNGAHVSFAEIWSMMESAGYSFHPDYPFKDPKRSYLPDLAETHRRVYGDFGLGSSIVWNDGGRVVGQAAGLRIHSRTWLVQHLAVASSFRRSEFVAHDLSSLVVEIAESLRDVDFIRYSWRLDNRYMNRLNGWMARVMNQRNLSWVRQLNYLRRPSASGLPASTMAVRPGTREDMQAIELHLRATGEVLRVTCEDLNADEFELGTLRDRFAAAGVERGRKLWVVDLSSGGAVYLFAEAASPGINLVETTNALYFIVPDREAAGVREACRSLVSHAAADCERRGRPSLVFLAGDGELEVLSELGFESLGRFAEWFFHRSLIRTWFNLSRSMFERVERRRDSSEAAQ